MVRFPITRGASGQMAKFPGSFRFSKHKKNDEKRGKSNSDESGIHERRRRT